MKYENDNNNKNHLLRLEQTNKKRTEFYFIKKKIPNDVNTFFFVCDLCVYVCFIFIKKKIICKYILNTKPQIYHHQHLIRSSNDQDVFIYEADAHTETFNI